MDKYDLVDRAEPSLSEWEKSLHDSVSEEAAWSLVEGLSEHQRISPSEDEKRAAEMLIERFRKYDIPYERYDPEFWLSVPNSASISVPNADEFYTGSEKNFEVNTPEVKGLSYSNDEKVTGEAMVIDVDHAENADEVLGETSVDLSSYNLEGKVVVVDAMILAKGFFEDIEAQGADALVMIHPNIDEPHISTATPIWGAIPRLDQRQAIPNMVYTVVSRSVGDRLLDQISGEETVKLEVSTDMTTGWFESPLVVARVPGEAEPNNDDFVLLHGHLDSWYYGTTDNATGNAGMVETARVLNAHRDRLRRDLWIAFWPAHEGGRYGGSSWFVDEFAHDLYENCVAHVNFDSPGVEDATEFNMTMWNIEGDDLCKSVIDDVTGKNTEWSRPPRAADYSFYNIGVTGMMGLSSGIPEELRQNRGYHAVGGSGGNSEAWHLTTDTIDVGDPEVLARDIRVYLILITRLLSKKVLPIDHRRTIANHLETVEEYDEIAGDHFDLSPVRSELEKLGDEVEKLYDRIDNGKIDHTVANEALKSLSRRLIPVNFTKDGRFDQDPAKPRPPYPKLSPVTGLPDLEGNDYKFRQTNLRRAVNEVVHELRMAKANLPE